MSMAAQSKIYKPKLSASAQHGLKSFSGWICLCYVSLRILMPKYYAFVWMYVCMYVYLHLYRNKYKFRYVCIIVYEYE